MVRLQPVDRVLVLLFAVLVPLPGVAGDAPPEILLGPLKLSPAIQVTVDQRNNLFQQSGEGTDARVDAAGLLLSLELPMQRSRFVLNYTPEYRRYENDVVPSDWVHVADSLLELTTVRNVELVVEDSFERGILAVDRVTGGGGSFQGDKFTRNQFSLRLRVPIRGRHGFQAGAYSQYLNFDTSELRSTFFDVSGRGLSAGYFYDLSEQLRLAAEFRLDQVEQERQPFLVLDPGSGQFVPLSGTDRQDYDLAQYTANLDGKISRRIQFELRSGYGQQRFLSSLGSDFSGLLIRGSLRLDISSRFFAELIMNRRPAASYFNVSNFFVSESAELRLIKSTPRRLRFSLSALYQTNDYSDPVALDLNGDGLDDIPADPNQGMVAGLVRRDSLCRGTGRVDFAILPGRLAFFMRASYGRRSSNVELFEYNNSSISLGLKFGWLGQQDSGI